MSIRMIGLDLDGTALNGEGRFSPGVRKAIAEAGKLGAHVVIATGRPVCSLPDEIYSVSGLEYVITTNGARIIRLDREKHASDNWKDHTRELTIYENLISPEATIKAAAVLRAAGANAEVMTGGIAYIGRREYDLICSGAITTRSKRYVTATRTVKEDILAFLEEKAGEVESISINYTTDSELGRVRAELGKLGDVTLTSSFPFNNELGGATTSKASALEFLMKSLGIARDELMVCGDSPNDAAMLKEAGLAVAMGNATPDVIAVSDFVTLSNTEDGVALAIERFVLNR